MSIDRNAWPVALRLGARRVISVCLVLLGSCVLLPGTAEHLWSAGLFFGLAGLGASGLWVPIITLSSAGFPTGAKAWLSGCCRPATAWASP